MCRQQSTQNEIRIKADAGHTGRTHTHTQTRLHFIALEIERHERLAPLHVPCSTPTLRRSVPPRILLKPNSCWFTPNLLCEAMRNNLPRRRYFYWILSDFPTLCCFVRLSRDSARMLSPMLLFSLRPRNTVCRYVFFYSRIAYANENWLKHKFSRLHTREKKNISAKYAWCDVVERKTQTKSEQNSSEE